MSILTNAVIPPWAKALAIAAAAAIVFAMGSAAGFQVATWKVTSEMNGKVQEEVLKTLTAENNLKVYVAQQELKLRNLEIEANQLAKALREEADMFKAKAANANSKYTKLLNERKETPGTLSTSAVDTVNSLILEWKGLPK